MGPVHCAPFTCSHPVNLVLPNHSVCCTQAMGLSIQPQAPEKPGREGLHIEPTVKTLREVASIIADFVGLLNNHLQSW